MCSIKFFYLNAVKTFIFAIQNKTDTLIRTYIIQIKVSVHLAFTYKVDAGVFHPFARHCLAFALFNQLSSHFDSLIPSNSMEFELCGCNYNLLNDPTWSASLRGVSGSVITIIHCFFISVNYNSDIFLNSSRFNSFLNSSSVGI